MNPEPPLTSGEGCLIVLCALVSVLVALGIILWAVAR